VAFRVGLSGHTRICGSVQSGAVAQVEATVGLSRIDRQGLPPARAPLPGRAPRPV